MTVPFSTEYDIQRVCTHTNPGLIDIATQNLIATKQYFSTSFFQRYNPASYKFY